MSESNPWDPMNMDAQFSIGKILNETARRDAIHFAVEPTVAAVRLFPSQPVALDGAEKRAVPAQSEGVGIVDPFLSHPVEAGERFWLFVYPNTITGLQHTWQHPAFDDEPGEPTEKEWADEFAGRLGLTLDRLMEYAREFGEHEDWYVEQGSESLRTAAYKESEDNWRRFWAYYTQTTGRKPVNDTHVFFSCSC